MTDEKENLYAAELPLDVEPKAMKLGPRQMIGLHQQIATFRPPEGEFEVKLHLAGLCVWIRSPSGEYYQVSHRELWEEAVRKIIEHEKEMPLVVAD